MEPGPGEQPETGTRRSKLWTMGGPLDLTGLVFGGAYRLGGLITSVDPCGQSAGRKSGLIPPPFVLLKMPPPPVHLPPPPPKMPPAPVHLQPSGRD